MSRKTENYDLNLIDNSDNIYESLLNLNENFETIDENLGNSGTTDYTELTNKPSINSVELSGNKTLSNLGIQATLVSGTNIKTINNQSILGSGNIEVQGGGGSANITSGTTDLEDGVSTLATGTLYCVYEE